MTARKADTPPPPAGACATAGRVWLDRISRADTSLDQIALALTGLLDTIVVHGDREDREAFLDAKWTEADEIIGRVLELADWHDTKATKARDYPGGVENLARMAKAAEVHTDAANRIRLAVYGEPDLS